MKYLSSSVVSHSASGQSLALLARVLAAERAAALGLAGLLFLALPARGAEPDALSQLDRSLPAVATFRYGQDAAPLQAVDAAVSRVAGDPQQRAEAEARLLALLADGTTRDGKEFICRQLYSIGTAKSVPKLEALLLDPELSHVARYALARNEAPAAGEALQRALGRAPAALQVGIINSLGDRRQASAVPDLRQRLADDNAAVAEAAATALGKIGGSTAAQVLQETCSTTKGNLLRRVQEALLLAADGLLVSGNRRQANQCYEMLAAGNQPKALQLAGIRGLLAAEGTNAVPLLTHAIQSPDTGFQAAAIGLARNATGAALTSALLGLLPRLSPEGQELLLGALAARGDSAALPAVRTAAASDVPSVRQAALEALGDLGGSDEVSFLIGLSASSTGRDQPVARASLVRLNRGDVAAALVHELATTDAKRQIEALRAIGARRWAAGAKDVLPLATGPNAEVRREALHTLGLVAGPASLEEVVRLSLKLQTAEDLAELEQAVASVFERVRDPKQRAAPLLAILGQATPQSQAVLLRLLGRAATPEALAAVRGGLKAQEPEVQEAAVRTLADWPDAAPIEDLLEQVRSGTTATRKVIALRGLVRLAAFSQNPATLYARALELAQRPEDKKLVLGSLGNAEPASALPLVEPFLENQDLRGEAASAVIQIADHLRQTDAPRAKTALVKALPAVTDPAQKQRGQEILNQIGQYEDHILDWLVTGPYRQKDQDAHALFDMVFPPEQAGATDVKWTKLTKGKGTWDVNLADALGGADDVVGYARTAVWSESEREVQLEVGSDDGIKVWLNDAVMIANNTERGLAPRQDVAKGKLKAGWNQVLVKVTNRGGGWGFGCRIRQPTGAALEGLKVEAR